MMPPSSQSAKAGFTLVELLVAIAVLSVLIILVSKIVGGASTIATYNNSHMDSNDQARLVFDRMANDFSRMLKRPDADVIFCKQTSPGINDTMFFFSESAGGFFQNNSNTASTSPDTVNGSWTSEKNNISLVGYRVNDNDQTASGSPYGQLERLGKALPWDSTVTASPNPFPMVYLTYPPLGTAPTASTLGTYSTADDVSTIYGAYTLAAAGNSSPVGTLKNSFNDSTDTDYHVLGSQVFRFEYSFLLKDGTQSTVPVMAPATATDPNGVPSGSNLQASGVPPTTDSATPPLTYPVGSRWYDTTDHIGYICTSNTAGQPLWKEIGVQDIAAIIVTIATLDNAGRYAVSTAFKSNPSLLGTLAQQFPKYPTGTLTNTAADNLVTSWIDAILPNGKNPSSASANTGLPQSIVSRIRVYQRFFYLNTP